ncbi:MAG: acyl carrier protein [Rhizobiales bacterium]|nr:acyl carrier protein [Hyphomicrobiales bacterium]
MLQSQDISTRVHQWIVGHFPLAKETQISAADSLLESGIVDSLGTLEIVMFLEKEFGVVVEDEDMVADHFETIQSIANFVGSKSAH